MHRTCLKCHDLNCAEVEGPKMIIRPLNYIKTHFSIKPSKKLRQIPVDWKQSTFITLEPDFLPGEFHYRVQVDSPGNL